MRNNLVPPPAVLVEYDSHGKRVAKQFDNPAAARRFYLAKQRAGKRPALAKPAAQVSLSAPKMAPAAAQASPRR